MAAPRAQHTTSNNVNPPQPPPATARTPGQGNSTDNSTARPPSAASPPSLDELLAMTDDEISHMSISALKTVLFQNHVNARLLLEKSDLVARVRALLGDERHERAREAAIHAREEEEINARQHAMKEEQRHREEQARQDRAQDHSVHTPGNDARHPEPKISAPPILGTSADLERNGLCVVCQDEEANIAIVDCGYVFIFPTYFCVLNECRFIAIWQCAATVQILSCPHPESVHFAAPVLSRTRAFYAYSNHNVLSPCFALFSIASSSEDPTHLSVIW